MKIDINSNFLDLMKYAMNEATIIVITDKNGYTQFANEKFEEISKYNTNESHGSNWTLLSHSDYDKTFFSEIWTTIQAGDIWRGELKCRAKDQSNYWVNATIVPFFSEDGTFFQSVSILQDITQQKMYEEKMKHMAYYDPLTTLPNRNFLNHWVKQRKTQDNSFALLFIDLDRFKAINDNYGHLIGDQLLVEVANRLKQTFKETDFISRQGGDEFIGILDGVKDDTGVKQQLNIIMEKLALPYQIKRHTLNIKASVGISIHHPTDKPNHSQIEKKLREADIAMYHAKKEGGDRYCFNTETQNKEMDRYYLIEKELTRVLSNDEREFDLHYQPFINLRENEIIGAEALIRWNHPTLGTISPVEFIPVLEDIGLISVVGNWVLETACLQMKKWLDMGHDLQKIAVNVSPIQFNSSYFIQDLKEILSFTDLPPHYLELEITEGTLLHIDRSSSTLKALRGIGVQVSIDDFGTGYSSLNYLKKLPINTLKIDKSFIDQLDADDKVIIDTIIQMGNNLSFNVIAEGIETERQLQYLANKNCHTGQGYLFSHPVDPETFLALFHDEKKETLHHSNKY